MTTTPSPDVPAAGPALDDSGAEPDPPPPAGRGVLADPTTPAPADRHDLPRPPDGPDRVVDLRVDDAPPPAGGSEAVEPLGAPGTGAVPPVEATDPADPDPDIDATETADRLSDDVDATETTDRCALSADVDAAETTDRCALSPDVDAAETADRFDADTYADRGGAETGDPVGPGAVEPGRDPRIDTGGVGTGRHHDPRSGAEGGGARLLGQEPGDPGAALDGLAPPGRADLGPSAGDVLAGPEVAGLATTVALAAAAATLGFWWAVTGRFAMAAPVAAAVLVTGLAVPAGLLLAAPAVTEVARRRAEDLGIDLDRTDPTAVARADTLVLRRGLLTTGQPWLVDVVTAEPPVHRPYLVANDTGRRPPLPRRRSPAASDEVLRAAAALAAGMEHPVAEAVVRSARQRGLAPAGVEVLAARPGLGVRGVVDGRIVVAGRERFVTGWAPRLPERLAVARAAAESAGQLPLLVGWDGAVRGVLVVGDPPRPTAAAAVAALGRLRVRPVLVSGGTRLAARATGDAVGIDDVVARIRPEATTRVVTRLQEDGRVVAVADPGHAPADALVAPIGPGRPDVWTAVDALRLGRLVDRLRRQGAVLALAPAPVLGPLAALGRIGPGDALVLAVLWVGVVAANCTRALAFRTARPPAHGRRPHRPPGEEQDHARGHTRGHAPDHPGSRAHRRATAAERLAGLTARARTRGTRRGSPPGQPWRWPGRASASASSLQAAQRPPRARWLGSRAKP